MRFRISRLLLLALIVLTAGSIYFPGLSGPFLFDDSHVVKDNILIKISSLEISGLVQAMESFSAGGRQLSMLSFALNHFYFGDSVWWYKFINVLIHCLNGILIYILTGFLVTQTCSTTNATHQNNGVTFIPLFVAAMWLVSPINLTSILYVSQRMTLLSSFFILLGLLGYALARCKIEQLPRKLFYLPLIIGCFTLLAYACKENGALLPLYIAALELVIFRFQTEKRPDKAVILIFFSGFVLVVLAVGYKFVSNPDWITSGYSSRSFTLWERVLTQLRALVFYISQILIPDNSKLGLWHDDYVLSTSIWAPVTTLFSGITLLLLGTISLILINRAPLIAFGIIWFFISHAIESTIIPLEIMHEHRNYLASFGIHLAVAAVLVHLFKKPRSGLLVAFVGLFGFNSFVLAERANFWNSRLSLFQHEAEAHPKSAIANYSLGIHYFRMARTVDPEYGTLSKEKLLQVKKLQPGTINSDLALIVASENGAFDFDEAWLQAAIDKFPRATQTPVMQAAIKAYLDCLDWDVCKQSKPLAHQFFDLLYDSDNYKLSSFYAFFYSGVGDDPDKAQLGFEKSITQGDAKSWTNYMLFLIRENRRDEACKLLDEFLVKMARHDFGNATKVLGIVSRIQSTLSSCNTDS